jgi:hypothetical protein
VESEKDAVRSRLNIIRGLLRRAFNGQSKYTVPEMKAEIARRLERAREMPESHKAILAVIRTVENDFREYRDALKAAGLTDEEIGPDSRALKTLSIRERLDGKETTYLNNEADKLFCGDARPDLNPAPCMLSPRPW